MADIAFGGVKNIVDIALKIKEAVKTADENKMECRAIGKCVDACSKLLKKLENDTEIMKSKDICEALLDVKDSFNEALELVNSCQQGHGVGISCWRYMSNLWKADDLAKQLKKVKEDISLHMVVANFAAGVDVRIEMQKFAGKRHLPVPPPVPTPPPANDQYCRPASVGRGGLKVVLLYAFDCTGYSPAWFKMEDVFWLVQEKLVVHFAGSSLGYIYVMSKRNTYTCDMKLVDSADTQAGGYKGGTFWHRAACNKSMASGLALAHQLISNDGGSKGVILLFSDGSINKGDFFDGAEEFDSKVPVHTFTLGGDAYNEGLRAIAAKSPGGAFNPHPVPDSPKLSMSFSYLMDSILKGRGPLDVVLVYGFDCTTSTPNWYKMDDVFWLLHEKLIHFGDSYLGYIYVMSTPNTYTYDMKLVDPDESQATGYKKSPSWRRFTCTKSMASGLSEAHKLISFRGHSNGTILFFSDGMINKGDFFDGVDEFNSKVPVHTFTLGGDEYNEGLRSIATKSPGGTFNPLPVPDNPKLSSPFSILLDSILSRTMNGSGRGPLDVVLLYGFDCTSSTPNWYKMDKIFWLVHAKLTHFVDSSLGYVYVMSTPNTYTSDMKLVDSTETEATGYKGSSFWHRASCTKNMASGLTEAHKLISYREHSNGIILLFSDGLINKGDFFDGAEDFVSEVPVHTFTLEGDAYNEGLRAIAENSPKGSFNPVPVPDDPMLWAPFSHLLDTILSGTVNNTGRGPLDVVLVYGFDCTTSTPNWYKMDDVFWLLHEKLIHFGDSYLGYIYVMSTPNTYTYDMKLVDPDESQATGYKKSPSWRRFTCTKSMASGLSEAHKLISFRGHSNGTILFFSDGMINKGDFFDGVDEFNSKVPVHTFTLGGDEYNEGLRSIATKSPGGTFNPLPVPDNPKLSSPFSILLDSILSRTMNGSGRGPLDVVLLYGFDCTSSTPNWYKMDKIFWLVHAKLTHFVDSSLGYVYVMSTPNTYTSDMKLVDSTETEATGYKGSSFWHRASCTKNMASGLTEAHKLISYREHSNGIILLFSDGLINKGDFFDGAEDFVSEVPVHTFTLEGDAYNEGLRAIAENSPKGSFNPVPVPDDPMLWAPFSHLLDTILSGTVNNTGLFDCTES